MTSGSCESSAYLTQPLPVVHPLIHSLQVGTTPESCHSLFSLPSWAARLINLHFGPHSSKSQVLASGHSHWHPASQHL